MKALGYARVSTQQQAKFGYSLIDQRKEIKRFCQTNGWKLIDILEDHTSGATLERKDLQRILEEVRKRSVDVVVVLDVSRLCRNNLHYQQLIHEFIKHNVRLMSVRFPFDVSTPEGEMVSANLAAFATYQRKIQLEKARKGRLRKAETGKWVVGSPKYGYRIGKDGKLKLHPKESKAIRLMVDLILRKGYKLYEVAHELDKRGFKPRRTKNWNTSSIFNILRSPNIIGKLKWNGIEIDCPAIVTVEEQNKIINRFTKNKKLAQRNYPEDAEVWFPAGIIRCWRCKSGLSGHIYKRKIGYNRKYICNGKRHKGDRSGKDCTLPVIKAELLESTIWKIISGALKHPDFLKQLKVQEKRSKKLTKEINKKVNSLTSKIKELDKRKDRLFELYERGNINSSDIEERLSKIDKEKTHLQEQQEKLLHNIRETELDNQKMEEIKKRFLTSNLQEQKLICREVVERILVDVVDGKLKLQVITKSFFPGMFLKHAPLLVLLSSQHSLSIPRL